MKPKEYIPIANFISQLLGSKSEIVIHDFANIEHSIIYIINGQITNRKIGDTITDLILKTFQEESQTQETYMTNYVSKNYNGQLLNSSTYFIYNDNKQLIGSLCINTDIAEYQKALETINNFLPHNNLNQNLNSEIKENFYDSKKGITLSKIDDLIQKSQIQPERMTIAEKKLIVEQLYHQGVFLLKGSVLQTAKKLKTSEATLYRYLREIKK